MTPEEMLYAALANNAPLSALVGGRIYPDFLPDAAPLPAVVYQRSGTDYELGLDGAVKVQRAIFEIWCHAESRSSAETVADAVTGALSAVHFPIVGRGQEYEPETDGYVSVVGCHLWVTS